MPFSSRGVSGRVAHGLADGYRPLHDFRVGGGARRVLRGDRRSCAALEAELIRTLGGSRRFIRLRDVPNDLRTKAARVASILKDQPGAVGAQGEFDDR